MPSKLKYISVKKISDLQSTPSIICNLANFETIPEEYVEFVQYFVKLCNFPDADVYYKDSDGVFIKVDQSVYESFRKEKNLPTVYIVKKIKSNAAEKVKQQGIKGKANLQKYFDKVLQFFGTDKRTFCPQQMKYFNHVPEGVRSVRNLDRFISSFKLNSFRSQYNLFSVVDDEDLTDAQVKAYTIPEGWPYVFFWNREIIKSTLKEGRVSDNLMNFIKERVTSARARYSYIYSFILLCTLTNYYIVLHTLIYYYILLSTLT